MYVDNGSEHMTINDAVISADHGVIANSGTLVLNGGAYQQNGNLVQTSSLLYITAGTTTVNGGIYKFITKKSIFTYAQKLFQTAKSNTLSQSALETLAIIAYKQPITRIEIEELRGVGSDMMLRKLQARNLIKEAGRSDAPGRPILYEVTEEFMDSFKLYSIDDGLLYTMLHVNYKRLVTDEDLKETFIANGETGIVKDVFQNYLLIDFDGVTVKYYRNDMQMVGLGYCITIHKSQGSSIKVVILLTPQSHTYMLNSNLVYVGLTRMKEKCFHLGNVDTVNLAVKKKANFTRNTFMQKLIKEICLKVA